MENKTIEEKIAEIEALIHDFHKLKLTNLIDYVKKLTELAKGEANTRKALEKEGLDKNEVKRLSEVAKTYLTEKNIIREIRYAIKLVGMEEQKLNTEKAKLMAQKTRR